MTSTRALLTCEMCRRKRPAHVMTVTTRPSGKRQYYCPACDRRRWAYAETAKGQAIAAARARRREHDNPANRVG